MVLCRPADANLGSWRGLRIVLIDFFPWAAPRQRQLLRGVVGLTFAAGVPGGTVILWPFVEGRILS